MIINAPALAGGLAAGALLLPVAVVSACRAEAALERVLEARRVAVQIENMRRFELARLERERGLQD